MILRNFNIASRFLLKHKEYTLVNIFGLTLSLTCVLFISLYIYDELSFDRFHRKADRIVRVIENETSPDGTFSRLADVPFLIATLHEQLPAIESSARITVLGRSTFYTEENDNKIYESIAVADQGFKDLFDFKVLYGSGDNALSESHSIVITRSTALKLFGKEDVFNKVIRIEEDDQPYRITAVLEDFPSNSHLNGNIILSMESLSSEDWYKKSQANDWTSNLFSTYLLLKEETDVPALEKAITEIVGRNRDDQTIKTSFSLQPLTDIHFYSADIRGGYASNPGDIRYLYIFGAVGFFVLLIACINYVNLSTSLSITRGKEVGVKKVAGAARWDLIRQFITESNAVSFLSLLIALIIVNILMPLFNAFIGKSLSMDVLLDLRVIGVLIGFTLIIGTLSGSYPAFYLSRFKPVQAIKGFSSGGRKTGAARQGLVVFQFALSIMLILATLIAQQQLSFVRNKNLGFQQDQLVILDINSNAVRKGFETIKNEIARIPAVKDVSVTSRVPGEWKNLPQVSISQASSDDLHRLFFLGVDDAFLKTFEISLVGGRNFSASNLSDSMAFIINETAAREMGLTNPVGENISIESVNFSVSDNKLKKPFSGKIIGIVKDFHFQSLHQKIGPLLMAYHNNPIHRIDYFSVRLSQNSDWPATQAALEKAVQAVDPSHMLEYNFLDQRLEDFYKQDTKRGQFFAMAATVSIGLACLGLFSLASFMTEQRTKEIGIRKALGATVQQIVMMLSGHYVKLVLCGFIIATPLAIWILNQWLQSFAYRIQISWLSVVAACVISLGIALLTVGYKSLQAAAENPVKSLRSE